jgi:hypothetical protein
MLEIVRSTQFAGDTKLAQRCGKDLNNVLAALLLFENEQPLPERYIGIVTLSPTGPDLPYRRTTALLGAQARTPTSSDAFEQKKRPPNRGLFRKRTV